jgi:O-antigen/teichoic acid export membrane protein
MNERPKPPRPKGLQRLVGRRGSLTGRAMRSSMWLLGSNLGMKALRLGSNLILVRLLAPEDFGLMALVFTLHSGLEMLTDVGLKPAVVRSAQGGDPRFLRTAWTLQAIKLGLAALIVAGVGALLGVLSASVDLGDTIYADPRLPALIAASALILGMNGLDSMNVATAERDVAMSRIIVVNATAYILSTGVIILWAWLAPSVWALLWGTLIGATLRCALSHLMLPGPRMGFLIDRGHATEIWGFGKWLMGSSALGFFSRHGDKLVLAALFDPTLFSFYAIARLWIDAARQSVNRVSGSIGLAAMSEVNRKRPADLPRAFRKYRLAQNAVCATAFLVFLVLGQTLIGALYPPDFAKVGALMPLLAPMLVLQMYGAFTSVVLMAGRSREFATVTLRRTVTLLSGIPVVYWTLGESWTVFFIAVNAAVGVPLLLRAAAGVVPVNRRFELIWLGAILAAAAATTQVLG